MSRSFDADDLTALGETFAEDLRAAFPEVELPERVVQDHVAAMISAAQLLAEEGGATVLEPASHPGPEGLTTPRRRWMRTRLIRRVVAVAAGLLLSLSGLAFAGAFEGSDDSGNDDTTAIVSHQTDDDQGEDGDDQGEDADDQGEDGDDQGEDADDQGEDGDDQGEDGDDQGEDENANDDQGDNDNDDQGDNDNDDQGDKENVDDDQGDGGDSQD